MKNTLNDKNCNEEVSEDIKKNPFAEAIIEDEFEKSKNELKVVSSIISDFTTKALHAIGI